MGPLELVKLIPLMQRSSGRPEVKIALIDGPVAIDHPDFAGQNVRQVIGRPSGSCTMPNSAACMHGTFVAGVLSAKRGSTAPAICPDCTLLVRPIFPESASVNGEMPSARPEELAAAVMETVNGGAWVINLSAALTHPSQKGEQALKAALDHAAKHGVIVVAAAGNQGMVGSSAITAHPWVIPVTSCDMQGRPTPESNLGTSIGRSGLAAPGQSIVSLGAGGKPLTTFGTSAAAPFVTGAVALLWSEFPNATAAQIKLAIAQPAKPRRTIVPPLLDAWASFMSMSLN